MTAKIKVLVVDDSVVMRRRLAEIIAGDPELEVLGTAANGRMALERITSDPPDIVTLDVEMPEMDGLTTLREIRQRWPRLPVVMCSSLTERGASSTLDALSAGANDYVTKPSNAINGGIAPAAFAADLVQKLRLLARGGRTGIGAGNPGTATLRRADTARSPTIANTANGRSAPAVVPRSLPGSRVDVVAIGSSTGGPNALAELLPQLPGDLPVPIVIVQHMPPLFTKLLAERLDKTSHLSVEEATVGTVLQPGHVYLAPGDFHLEVQRNGAQVQTWLHKAAQENSCRPAVDVLLRSVVTCYGRAVLAVILTGMGQDGLRGCEQVVASGGQVIAQDEATSVVWGMPGFVSEAGLAGEVLPLSGIAPAIIRRVKIGGNARRPNDGQLHLT